MIGSSPLLGLQAPGTIPDTWYMFKDSLLNKRMGKIMNECDLREQASWRIGPLSLVWKKIREVRKVVKKQEDIPGKNLSTLLKQANKTSWQMNGIKEMLQH